MIGIWILATAETRNWKWLDNTNLTDQKMTYFNCGPSIKIRIADGSGFAKRRIVIIILRIVIIIIITIIIIRTIMKIIIMIIITTIIIII